MKSEDYDVEPLLNGPSGIPRKVSDRRTPYQKKLAVLFILVSTFFERATFYAFIQTFLLNLQTHELFNWTSKNSIIASYMFSGVSYISALIFSIISDAKFGRAKTIIFGFFLYIVGFILMLLLSSTNIHLCQCQNNNSSISNASVVIPMINEPCVFGILGTLIIIAIGAGAVQANMAVFGADHYEAAEFRRKPPYFDIYIVVVNVGSMVGVIFYASAENKMHSYFIGYLIVLLVIVIAALIFVFSLCRNCYLKMELNETVVSYCILVIRHSFKNWRIRSRNSPNPYRNVITRLCCHQTIPQFPLYDEEMEESDTRLPRRIVDDVRSLRRALFVFILLIPYWLIYDQMDTTYRLQGKHMKQILGTNDAAIYVALGDPITIVFGILILNVFTYQYENFRPTYLKRSYRFVSGMFVGVLVMFIVAIIEIARQYNCDIGKDESNLSIFAQLPQYILSGVSELFATVAAYEYAYYAAPRSAQSLFMSLHFVSLGVAAFINAVYIAVYPTPSFVLDFTCHVEESMSWSFSVYFVILGALQMVIMIVFKFSCRRLGVDEDNPQRR